MADEIMKKCVELISMAAEEKKLTLRGLERKVGLSPGYISRCKNGNKRLSFIALHKIEEYLGVDIYKRMWEDDEE